MIRWMAMAGVLALAGCGTSDAVLGYAEGAGAAAVEQTRRAKDIEARTVKEAACLMSVGAYHRVLSPREQAAVAVLCGGDDGAGLERP